MIETSGGYGYNWDMNERGPEGIGFNESLTRSFKLAETFRKSGVLGEKTDPNSRDKANEKVSEILSTSFPINYKDQYNNVPQYESVREMILMSQDSGKTDAVRDRAKNALFEIGLALSQNKEILKAATEGAEELNKLTPSNLHEIHPYILSTILTNGKDDKQGLEMVNELVDLFKLKKKATERPDFYQDDFKSASKALFDKLYDRCEELDSSDIEDGTEGRIETTMGYILGMNESKTTSSVREVEDGRTNKDTMGDLDRLADIFMGKETSETSWDTYLEAIIYNSNFQISAEHPPLWKTNVPEWYPNGKEDWRNLLDTVASFNTHVAAKHAGMEAGKLFDHPGAATISESYLTHLYKKEPGFKAATKAIFEDLFEMVKVDGAPVLKLKINTDVKTHLTKFPDYKTKLAEKIVKEGIVDSLDYGKICVSLAGNLFVDASNLVDSADFSRGYNERAIDPVRTYFHPNEKLIAKTKVKKLIKNQTYKEDQFLFASNVGKLVVDLAEIDSSFASRIANKQKTYLPEIAGLSWVEIQTVKVNGEEMYLSEALMKHADKDIDFGDAQVNILGKYKRDYWTAITKVGDYVLGKEKIGKDMEDWSKKLCNALSDMRETGHPVLINTANDPDTIAAIIVNSWPDGIALSEDFLLNVKDYSMYNLELSKVLDRLTGISSKTLDKVREKLATYDYGRDAFFHIDSMKNERKRRINADKANQLKLHRKR